LSVQRTAHFRQIPSWLTASKLSTPAFFSV
jgi:hypothetical protein